jgi:hypothetical protein
MSLPNQGYTGPAPHHDVDATVGDVLKRREVFRDLHRVACCDERRGCREDDPLGARGDVAEQGGRR